MTATEVVTTVTETETTTSVEVTPVIESLAPSTNLTEAQPEPTQEATTVQEASDTQSGEIAVTNASEQLNAAVHQAEQEGVQVKEEVAKDYGVTTSAEETAAKQAEIQTDYAKQTEEITKVTENYVAEKEAHAVATEKVIVENNQLKEEYDAKIAAYNAEVKKVNAANAAIDAAYDKARQAYETEVEKITASNNQAKEQYEAALKNYKAEVQRITQDNAQKKASYEQSLRDYNNRVQQVNSENQRLEAEYQAAYKTFQETVAQIKTTNAERESSYNKALATYQAEVERINRDNEAKRQAYESTKVSNASNVAAIEAENKLIEQRNQAARDAYNKAKVAYDTAKAKYDQALAEAKANVTREGYSSKILSQYLNLAENEPNSVVSISGGQKYIKSTNEQNIYLVAQDTLKGMVETSPVISKMEIPNKSTWAEYGVVAKSGETITADFTRLENSTYDGGGISKIRLTITPVSNDGSDLVVYLSDRLTNGYEVYSTVGNPKDAVTLQFFDVQGNVISFSEDAPALFGFGSLNRHPGSIEYISDYNFDFVSINGSTIVEHSDGFYSDGDNDYRANGSKYDASEWDPDGSPLAYYGAGIGVVTSGNTISFTAGNKEFVGHWTDITSKVAASGGIIETPPKEPVLKLEELKTIQSTKIPEPTYEKLPDAPTVSYLATPDAPKKPSSEKVPDKPEVPTYEGLPDSPTVSYHEIPKAPEKGPSVPLPEKPEEPTYKELPKAPKTPTVTYNLATLATQPQTSKEVETTEGVNVDKGLVAKGQDVVFELLIDSLSANRALTTSGEITDPLPTGFELDLEKTVNANSAYELTYSTDKHTLVGNFTKELILSTNRDLTKSITLPSLKVYGRVLNDATTYKNTFTLVLNGGQGKVNGYTRTSNTVVVHTPGDPNDPDNPTNNEIKPTKRSTNAAGVIIDGKPVPVGGEIFYRITLDYDQYHAITPDKETIGKGFGGFDDYPEEALAVDLGRAIIIDSDGKPVTGLLLKDNASFATSDSKVQELLTQSGIKSKISGAFVSVVAEDPFAYYENIIKAKKSVTILIPMTVKEGLYNTGTKVSNTAYQLDFGNGYMTNTVTNPTPIVTPTKVNTNSQGVVINGKPVLANSVNYYKVELDYSDYKGIEADEKLIALGFYGLDDYPEEALVLETSGFQFIASDNSLVKGLTATAYADLLEAPKALQEAMAKQGFKPKGAILVFSADDPQAYYEAYVKTGMKITATLPMTVKAELAKTGGTYENTAYQSEFGSAYVTDTIVNNVPKLDPKKDIVIDLSHDTESLAGKDIEVGTIFNYLLAGAELPAGRGSDITSYTWFDDYDENRDQYDGVYKIFAPIAFKTKDGISYAARTELTRYAIQTVDTATGKTFIKLDEDFLRSIDSSSAFKADLYLQMKRVGTGDVYNSYTHGVNGAEVESNTTVSHTPVGDVTVSYKEKGGKELKQPVVDTPEGSTGRDYDTTDNKPEEIITEDGKVFKLVPELTEGKETGKVTKGNTNVTYVYEEVKADVLINYIDESGNVIKQQVKDVDQGSIGSDYDTTDNKPEFIEVDGVKYKLMPKKTIGNETGKLPREGAEVTYVYHKIVTNWVEEGTRDNLKPQEDGEKERGSFEGYEYVEKEVDEETGDITYVFKKIPQPVPAPEKPKPTPVAETPKPQSAPVVQAATLPVTGEESSVGYVALGMVAMTAAAGLAVTNRRKEENQ